jgi:hypothetical protein
MESDYNMYQFPFIRNCAWENSFKKKKCNPVGVETSLQEYISAKHQGFTDKIIFRHVVKHGVESGVFLGVEFGVSFGVEFGVVIEVKFGVIFGVDFKFNIAHI